jgi:hypothetical protein
LIDSIEGVISLCIAALGLTDTDVSRLVAGSPHITAIALLDCAVGDAGAEAIARHLPNLTNLDLGISPSAGRVIMTLDGTAVPTRAVGCR